jgi:outer membrane protein TolC
VKLPATLALVSAAGLLAAPAIATAEPRRITLPEAISLATEGNIQIELAEEDIHAAEQEVKGTRSHQLPQLQLRANVLLWNDDVPILFNGVEFGVAREQVTGSLDVVVAQPLTGAVLIGKLARLQEAGVDYKRAQIDVKKLQLAYQAAELYLGALQARQLQDISRTSIAQIDAAITRVKALVAGGLLDDVDVLRLEASREEVRQRVLDAEVAAEQAERTLALVLGLPDGTDLELVDVDPTPPPLGWTEDDAVAEAKKRRPEVRAADALIVQGTRGVDVAKAYYIPEVNLIAAYTHTEGQGEFATKDAAYLGLQLQWTAWDWGKRKSDVERARSGRRSAEKARAFVDDQLALEVRTAWLAADSAQKSLAVAESGLKAAEEAYRLQTARFAQGVAVTTDVLDAESEVARSRSLATIARYQYLVKCMALTRAVGATPGT